MSIYDKASLVLIPSGTKTSKVYSQKPTNGDGDFTFSRSTAATRVNASGSIEKETQNFALQSNSFSTSPWSLQASASLTSGQAGYDGTNNAWLLSKAADYSRLEQNIVLSGVWTFSCYAKAGTLDWVSFENSGIAGDTTFFNLNSGTLGTLGSGCIDSSIEDVGSGWYRCSVTISGTSAIMRIQPSVSNGVANGSNGNIYIQDAQLEQGLVARDYIETTTTAIYGGITDNVPRLDYTDSSCPALLLEPQRTNVWKHSEYVSGNHLVGPPTITENYAESPEGLNNAFRIQDTTGTSFKRIAESSGGLSVSVNSTYTQSLFVKKATSAISSNGGVGFDYSGGTRQISYIIFDEYNGTMTALQSQSTLTLHDAEDYGDYWRFSITAKDTGNNTNLSLNVYACLSGNGTSISLGTKDWTGYGLQLEAGSYPTSYIPTYGSAVTRNNDYMKLLASNFYSTTSYTYFLDIDLPYDVGTSSSLWKDNDNLSSNGGFQLRKTSPTGSYVGITTHNGSSFTGFFTNVLTGRLKLAIIYNNGQVSVYYNGVQSGSAISVTGWNQSTNHFKFEDGSNGAYETNQFLYLPTALTDQEAIDLTTI